MKAGLKKRGLSAGVKEPGTYQAAAAAGAWTGKKILDCFPILVFVLLVQFGLVVSEVLLLVTGG